MPLCQMCKYANVHTCKYANTETSMCSNLQTCKYTHIYVLLMKVKIYICKCTNIQQWNVSNMQIHNHVNMCKEHADLQQLYNAHVNINLYSIIHHAQNLQMREHCVYSQDMCCLTDSCVKIFVTKTGKCTNVHLKI